MLSVVHLAVEPRNCPSLWVSLGSPGICRRECAARLGCADEARRSCHPGTYLNGQLLKQNLWRPTPSCLMGQTPGSVVQYDVTVCPTCSGAHENCGCAHRSALGAYLPRRRRSAVASTANRRRPWIASSNSMRPPDPSTADGRWRGTPLCMKRRGPAATRRRP